MKSFVGKSPFDHLLAAIGGVFATFCLGHSVGSPEIAQIFSLSVVVASLIGLGLSHALRNSKVLTWDGWFLGFLGLASVFLTPVVNSALPGEGFPISLRVGVTLSVMVILGSLVAWRDGTLLFLSLPSIAIFGLVGVFDIYRPAVVLFFLFTAAVAVLYARSYLRLMVERAKAHGAEPTLLRRDVWKWVAGPEWAFGSAGIVIVISLMLGPILQVGLAPISGVVRLAPTQNQRLQNTPQASLGPDEPIGTGPRSLTDTPILKVKIDYPRYLRRRIFYRYNRTGWVSVQDQANQGFRGDGVAPTENGGSRFTASRPSPFEPMDTANEMKVSLLNIGIPQNALVSPGPIIEINEKPENVSTIRGEYFTRNTDRKEPYEMLVEVPDRTVKDESAAFPGGYPESWQANERAGIPQKVREFAQAAVANETTDLKKCYAIMKAIGNQAKYNTQAPATPVGADPVEHFLFTSQVGYCDLFASSFVQMARSVGIPARYVSGYAMPQDLVQDEQGYYTVLEKNGHAWAEVYFEGVGWMPFDPTALAENVTPASAQNNTQSKQNFDPKLIAMIAGGVLALIAAFVAGLALVKRLMSNFQQFNTGFRPILRQQNRFQFAIEGVTKQPRRFSQSIVEFSQLSGHALGEHASAAMALAERFEALLFSCNEVSPTQVEELRKETDTMVKSLAELKKKK